MKPDIKMARRYHWFNVETFTMDPHRGISGIKRDYALNTVSGNSREYQKTLLDVVSEDPRKVEREVETLKAVKKGYRPLVYYKPEDASLWGRYESLGKLELNRRALEVARELSVSSYDELLLIRGLGPSTLRALSLVLELVYDVHPSWKDPVTHPPDPFKFAYAVGGKVPFPVERSTYDELNSFLELLVEKGKNERELIKQVMKISKRWKFPAEEKRAT